ncbi:phage baseplate assembly protein [Ancylobacter oerskovii]|uniref:Phage baseplate assembly protein n=1 Tax=Ancylobacter oerskovii TaxID=459519 RepID=A0ABW4Z3V0_9HYPH|nr:hypothetical protein [Ancylobacter oerskovii]MBS7546252.1 hypothetical protein [Ancylobacter oerskovii]
MTNLRARLSIGAQAFEGWKTVEVRRAFDAASSGFMLEVVDTEAAPAALPTWPIKPFDACTVQLGGVKVITGFVDRVEPSYDASRSAVRVAGRSKTADAVDCSAIVPGGNFKGYKLDAIANNLAGTVGVRVTAKADVGEPFEDISIDPGATVVRALTDLCDARGVMLHDDEEGNLVIDEAEETDPVAWLVEGENILAAQASLGSEKRFSKYVGKSQRRGSDDAWGEVVSEITETRTDSAVPRYRPLLLAPEEPLTTRELRDRLDWEAAVREGAELTADVTVLGWFRAPGKLWTPGETIHLASPKLYVDRPLALREVTFRQGQNGGTVAVLRLVPHSALNKKSGGKGKGKKKRAKGAKGGGFSWDGVVRVGDDN